MKLIAVALVALFSAQAAAPSGSPAPPTSATAASAATVPLETKLGRIDGLHRRRDDRSAWAEEQQLVQAALAEAPGDYRVLWRAARFYFWLSDDPSASNDQRSKWGEQGWNLAEHASSANPNDVAGHYWAAVCMGNYALGLGVMKALSMGLEGKFKDQLKRAGELDPGYEYGSIDTAWGRFYDKLPWPKRDRAKARQYLTKVLQLHGDNLRARVFLAASLMDDGHPAEAKTLLDQVAAAQPGKYDAPEERRAKALGTGLMSTVLAKLK